MKEDQEEVAGQPAMHGMRREAGTAALDEERRRAADYSTDARLLTSPGS